MSQFGGGRPGSWGRPAGAPGGQMPGLPPMNFPMVGMGVPMGMVNQAAFSQPNMMGMQGLMGAVPQQQLPQPQVRPPQGPPQVAPQNGIPGQQGKNQRTFVGIVTKMLDSYGFVDDDVFFQHNVIRGAHPRVGDKVMVEANYNPSMPFKWNAFRIQLLNASQQEAVPPVRQPGQQQRPPTNEPSSRWGPGDRNGRGSSPPRGGSSRRSPVSARRSPPPPRRQSPPKRDVPRSNRRPSPRRSPVASRRSSPPAPRPERTDRKRDRSPGSGSVAPSSRRDSASPPRRRARIIPRYDCRVQKQTIINDPVSCTTLRSRYNKMYLPSDFVDLSLDWVNKIPLDSSINVTNPVQFQIFHKEVDFPLVDSEDDAVLEPEDADHRYQVKVLLLSHHGKEDILKKAYCLLPDGASDDHQEPQSIFKNLHFLVGTRGKETMAIGGSWSPSLDGEDPTSPSTLIHTAIRTTKALTGIDLSSVPQWYSMVQVRYYRSDKDRVDRVHLLWPDTQLLTPDDDSWAALQSALDEQHKTKTAAVDALCIEEEVVAAPAQPDNSVVTAKDETTENGATNADVTMEEAKPDESIRSEDATAEGEKTEANASGPSHWSAIDPKALKVAELRTELELRGLETKGIKTLLVQRLQTALDGEKAAEESKPQDVEMKEVVEEVKEVKAEPVVEKDPAAFIAPSAEETQKSEAEAKKEEEERQKKIDKLEKEKKEKRESLERHYAFPKEKRVLVFPSKTAKQGKFDCKVMSIQSLLEYRSDDNKEAQFEVSLFAEAFRELTERNAAFGIYQTLVNCAEKDVEKKRRDEAKGRIEKKDEEKKEGEAEKKEGEKKEEEKEKKVELKSVISNRTVFEAFAFFDQNLCGYLMEKDVEEILYNGEFGISRGQIQRLAKKMSARDRINYRHLTDVLVDSDGVVKFTPGGIDDQIESDVLARGYGLAYAQTFENTSSSQNGGVTAMSDGNVVINGSVINVPLKLKLLKTMEQERDAARATANEHASLIEQLREAKADLEKKRKEIEKDYEKSKKKTNDLGSSLKSALDETSTLKSALSDCRKYADRLISSVEKAMPPPKKESPKEKEKEKVPEKVEKTEKEESVPVSEEVLPTVTEMVLTEEVGPEEEEDKKEVVTAEETTI